MRIEKFWKTNFVSRIASGHLRTQAPSRISATEARITQKSIENRKVVGFRDWNRSTDQRTTDPGDESLPADSALSPGSPSSRRRSGMWKRTSGSCPIHSMSTEWPERRALSTKRAPESRITRCRPSDCRRTRDPEVGQAHRRIAPPTLEVRVPDQSLTTLK